MIDMSYELIIPANTSQNSPVALDCPLGEGLLKRVIITFKRGCLYYAKVAIFYGGSQLMPIVNGQGYAYDDYNLILYPDINITGKHHIMTVKGWADGTLYSHTIRFLFSVDSVPNSELSKTLASLF